MGIGSTAWIALGGPTRQVTACAIRAASSISN
jgi:hypothetical protein